MGKKCDLGVRKNTLSRTQKAIDNLKNDKLDLLKI